MNSWTKKTVTWSSLPTHVMMNVDNIVAATLGSTAKKPKLGSGRGYRTIPMSMSCDLTDLQRMRGCGALTAVVVSLHGAIPSLIYSNWSLHESSLVDRFGMAKFSIDPIQSAVVLRIFVQEVLDGFLCSADAQCRQFDMFSSIISVNKIQWPLFYIGCICNLFKSYEPALTIGKLVCTTLLTYSENIGSGKDWEVIVTTATILRCLHVKLSGAAGTFNIVAAGQSVDVMCQTLLLQTLETVHEYVVDFFSSCASSRFW